MSIENTEKNSITQDIEKIYSKIKKDYIDKTKTIEDIQKYLQEKGFLDHVIELETSTATVAEACVLSVLVI